MPKKKDIDILFVGSILPRRKKIIEQLKKEFNIEVHNAYGIKMTELFNRAKIVLNIHAEDYLDTETRIFEALGCGAFVISEELSSENPFISGKDYIEVNSLEQMKNKIKYYLTNSIERNNIALSGYKEAIENHSYKNRAKQFINYFNRYAKQSISPTFSSKKLVFYSQIEQILNKFR